MVRPTEIEIVRHVPFEELERILADYEGRGMSQAAARRVRDRVFLVRQRYMGRSVEEAAATIGMTTKSGYNIQKAWNEGGPAALEPSFNGGRRPLLTESQKGELSDALSKAPMSTKEARRHIAEEYGVDYSEKQVHVILKGMGMRHAKPYPSDHRRPADAEAVLKKGSRMLWHP